MQLNLCPKKAGFALIELTIVVVILGATAMFAVPRFMRFVEKTTATETFSCMTQMERAQARSNAANGKYAIRLHRLDLDIDLPEFFSVGRFSGPSWQAKGK